MPLFVIQSFKRLESVPDREWSNSYLVEADTLDTVAAADTDFISQEKAVFMDNVQLTRRRYSDFDPATDLFTIVVGLVDGTRGSSDGVEYLPLYNTIRVDINVAGGGRPSRKYYRAPVTELDQVNGRLVTATIDNVQAAVNGLISAMSGASAPLVDPDGQLWVSAVCQTQVQMRQLHRKRRKAVAPAP